MWHLIRAYPAVGYLTAVALFAIYILLLKNEKYWLWFEILLGMSYIISLPLVNQLLSAWLAEGEADMLSRNLLCLVMLGMIAQSAVFYFTKDSEDRIIKASLSLTNIMGRGGLLFSAAYALFYIKGFNLDALRGDCIFLSLLVLGDLLRLNKLSTKDGCLALGEKTKYCASIDAVMSFVAGLFLLGFPETSAGYFARSVEVTGIHVMFMKSFGLQIIASAMLSFASLCYKDWNDVASVLRGKFAIYVPMALAAFWYCITTEPGPTNWGCVLAGVGSLFLVLNCVVAQVDLEAYDAGRVSFG